MNAHDYSDAITVNCYSSTVQRNCRSMIFIIKYVSVNFKTVFRLYCLM